MDDIYTKDELLDFVHIYWFGNSIGSSMRLYYEEAHHSEDVKVRSQLVLLLFTERYSWFLRVTSLQGLYIEQPCGYTHFPKEVRLVREWEVKLYLNLVFYNESKTGGHFAALEEPEKLNSDIREFFQMSGVRQRKKDEL